MDERKTGAAIAKVMRHGGRAVRVIVRPEPGGWRLMQLEPVAGLLPEWDHLAGELFLDEDGVRRAIQAALRGSVGDTLDWVRLDEQAYRDWLALAQQAAARWAPSERLAELAAIPDERARILPDGSLEIYLDLPGERISLVVPPERWAWRVRPS